MLRALARAAKGGKPIQGDQLTWLPKVFQTHAQNYLQPFPLPGPEVPMLLRR